MLLGIGLHAALSFYPTVWPVTDSTADLDGYFDEFVLAVHGFRMPLFFLLSGFFTVLLWRRRGLGNLLGHRLRRLLVPFILAVILIAPTVTWVSDRAIEAQLADDGDINGAVYLGDAGAVRAIIESGTDPDAPGSDGNTPLFAAAVTGDAVMVALLLELGADPGIATADGMPIDVAAYFGHEAAAEALLEGGSYDPRAGGAWQDVPYWALGDVSDLGAPRVDLVATAQPPPSLVPVVPDPVRAALRPGRLAHGSAGSARSCRPRVIALARPRDVGHRAPRAAAPVAMEGGGAIRAFGPDTSIGWIPAPHVFVYYLLFFTFGALLDGRPGSAGDPIVESLGRRWWLQLGLAVVVFLAALWAMGAPDRLPDLAMSGLQVAYAWLMIFGLMGLFRAALSRERYWVRYLSDSAYWMYLMHLTLVIALQAWVRTWDVSPVLKFGLIVVTTCAILLLLYRLVVRYTFVGTMLNGKRSRPQPSSQAP